MSNILVTGGAGFIGNHLIRDLVKCNHKVTVLDNLFRSDINSIKDLIDTKKIEFVKGDIRDKQIVDSLVEGKDYVFHLAAVCINYSVAHPEESLEINLIGSENVFSSALKHKVKRVIFSSSASVYGDPDVLPMREDGALKPITPYCIAKLAGEYLLKFYSRSGLKYNILRYFNVYGAGQTADAYYTSVIINFIKKILSKQPPVIDGEGRQSMDFVNVQDIVQANMLAMNSNIENEIFNVGTGISTTIADLAAILIKSLNVDITPAFNKREVLVKERRADIAKIQKQLGFKVTVNAKDGLNDVARDIAAHPEKY